MKTKQTHKLIPTDNYDLIVGEGEIKNYYWNPHLKEIGELNGNITIEICNAFDYKKILFHRPKNNAPVLDGVELFEVVDEESIDELAKLNSEKENAFPYSDFQGKEKGVDDEHTGQALRGAYCQGFEDGYNYKEGTFSREQMEEFGKLCYNEGSIFGFANGSYTLEFTKTVEFSQLLTQFLNQEKTVEILGECNHCLEMSGKATLEPCDGNLSANAICDWMPIKVNGVVQVRVV